jgi:hypothetical protein
MNSVNILTPCLRSILMLSHLRSGHPSGSFPSVFSIAFPYRFLISPISPILFDLIISFHSSSMALQPFFGSWPLFFSYVILFTQTVRLFRQVISQSQGRYLHTGQHKHRINAHTHIHALSEILTHDPSFPARDDSSCLIPRCHCDWLDLVILIIFPEDYKL